MELAIAILGILAVAIPFILKALTAKREEQEKETNALVQRDLDVLHAPPTDGGRVQPAEILRKT